MVKYGLFIQWKNAEEDKWQYYTDHRGKPEVIREFDIAPGEKMPQVDTNFYLQFIRAPYIREIVQWIDEKGLQQTKVVKEYPVQTNARAPRNRSYVLAVCSICEEKIEPAQCANHLRTAHDKKPNKLPKAPKEYFKMITVHG